MFCDNCKTERLVSDFINNQKFCFHCVYREKVQKNTETQTQEKRNCRNCNKEFIRNKNEKKRQRTVFCSSECASEGHKKQLSNHWTRKVRDTDVCCKRGKGKWKIDQLLILQEKPQGRFIAMRRLKVKEASSLETSTTKSPKT